MFLSLRSTCAIKKYTKQRSKPLSMNLRKNQLDIFEDFFASHKKIMKKTKNCSKRSKSKSNDPNCILIKFGHKN